MASIGQIVDQTSGSDALTRARQRAALVPDCMVEARRIANTVIAGWHGRRKHGIGENFWQFRPYAEGESLSRIDCAGLPATTIPMSATANGRPPTPSGYGPTCRRR